MFAVNFTMQTHYLQVWHNMQLVNEINVTPEVTNMRMGMGMQILGSCVHFNND